MEPLDSDSLHDPATLAYRQYQTLKNNGAPETECDLAWRAYLAEVENEMAQKERVKVG